MTIIITWTNLNNNGIGSASTQNPMNITATETPTDGGSTCTPCVTQGSNPSPLTSTFDGSTATISELSYGVSQTFKVWLDCSIKGAIRFEYNARYDCGCEERHGSFKRDPSVSDACQQNNGDAYPRTTVDGIEYAYDRSSSI